MITGEDIKDGNVIIALPSSGLHSNGFSLVRKVIKDYNETFEGKPIYEELLKPTKLYIKPILELLKEVKVNGLAHITGGGLEENVPRIIPEGFQAVIEKSNIKIPAIFKHISEKGVNMDEMYGTFNMGVGFIIVADKENEEKIMSVLNSLGEEPYKIGEITKGDSKICLK